MCFTIVARPGRRTSARGASRQLDGRANRQCRRGSPGASRSCLSASLRVQCRGVLSQLESRSGVTSACEQHKPNRRSRCRRRVCGSTPSLPHLEGGKWLDSECFPRNFPPTLKPGQMLYPFKTTNHALCNLCVAVCTVSNMRKLILFFCLLCSFAADAQRSEERRV